MLRWLLLACLWAMPVTAGPDRISILGGSKHFGTTSDFQEFNPGLFLTWERARIDWSLGVYLNSYGRLSVAGTGALPLWHRGDFELDAFAGLALYPVDGSYFAVHLGDVVPIGGLQARWRNLFVQVIPLDGVVADAVVSFGVTFAR